MKFADRLKFTTTVTSSATISLSATVAGFKTLADAVTAGEFAVGDKELPFSIDDGNGNWENGYYTLTNSTTLTRESIVSSSNSGNAVTFSAGSKTVSCTAFSDFLRKLAGVFTAAFNTTIPLHRPGTTYMTQTQVSSALTFTASATAVRGALVYLRLVADGTNTPTFSGFKEWGGSIGYDNRNGIVNQIQFFYDGSDSWFSASQAVNATPVPVAATGVTLSGPTTGVVSKASTAFTVGITPSGSTVTGTVVVTPSDGGAGGTFTPSTVSLTTSSNSATFTYTPSATGDKTVSVTNNGSLTNPTSIIYTVTAAPVSAYSLTMTNPTYNATGKFGNSLSGGYGMATNPLPNTTPATIEFWAKTTTAATQPAIGCSYGVWIGSDSNGKATLHWGGDSGGTSENVISTTVTINDGAWHHYSGNIDPQGVGATLYIDGVLVGSNSTKGTIATGAMFGVRAFGGNTGFAWSGEVDEVAVYSGVKRTANFTPQTSATSNTEASLLTLWHLDGNGNDSNAISTTTYTRLVTLNKVVETGTGPYSYQGQAGNWLNGAGGVSKPLAANTDGSIAFGVNALSTDVGLLVGTTTGSTKVPYSGMLVSFYIDTQSNNHYTTLTNGDAGNRQDSGVTAQVGDIMRLRRAGTSVIAEYARSSAPTSFTTIYTWNNQTTSAIYFQVDVSGASTVAQNLTGVGVV